MPRFSARLLAIEDCGSLRRDVGGVDEVVGGTAVLPIVALEAAAFVVLSVA
jgi:hypothetical protein